MRNKDDDTEICTIKRDKKAMVVRYIFAVINGLILQGRKNVFVSSLSQRQAKRDEEAKYGTACWKSLKDLSGYSGWLSISQNIGRER